MSAAISPTLGALDSPAVYAHIRRIEAEADAALKAEASMSDAFFNAVMAGDFDAPALWALYRGRTQTVGECIESSLDYGNGPSTLQAIALLAKMAAGKASQKEAETLVRRMADTFARFNAEVEA